VQVSENDPIRDYGILFAIKLKKSGAQKVLLKEHKNVPHGILNMNSPIFELKKESNQMIQECIDFIVKEI
jgi:acetyl esterase/lipase